jgi:hypothetical protein
MRKLVSIGLLVSLLALAGCSNITLTVPPDATGSPSASATATATPDPDPDADADPDPEVTTDPVVGAPDPVTEELPALVPASTGPANIQFTRSIPKAKQIIIDSHAVTTIALDGTTLGTYVLPGDLYTLLIGISTALGRAPTVISHAPYNYEYAWAGLTVTDFSPSITRAGDPPYKITASARTIAGVQLLTANGIAVGDAASTATTIADEVIDAGYYWASIDAFHVAMPGVTDGRIYMEISAPSGAGAITEIRGPTGSWTT